MYARATYVGNVAYTLFEIHFGDFFWYGVIFFGRKWRGVGYVDAIHGGRGV